MAYATSGERCYDENGYNAIREKFIYHPVKADKENNAKNIHHIKSIFFIAILLYNLNNSIILDLFSLKLYIYIFPSLISM